MANDRKIRVLVVDDSAVVREALSLIINQHPGMEVMATAGDPYVAAEKIRLEVPDVVTLDVEMPRMDGITFLKRVMSQRPMPVVVCSSLVGEGTKTMMAALDAGAIDIIQKPALGTRTFFEESAIRIQDVILAASKARLSARRQVTSSGRLSADAVVPANSIAMAKTTQSVVAIGASTGGTEALKSVLTRLPPFAPPIVIVQHMPEHFTSAFAKRLDSECQISVSEARDGDSVIRGQALIAPGNRHMTLLRSGANYRVRVIEGPLVNRHRPSVDVLFRSVAQQAGANAIGVIMTGMGDDGARGLKEMRDAGARTIGQDETTCVVYGMSKEAMKHGGVEVEVGLQEIPGLLISYGEERVA